MSARTMTILDPTARAGDGQTAPSYDLGRPVRGARIGLRLDRSWRSYETVVAVWQRLLEADGAQPEVLVVGERIGEEGERTRNDLEEWCKLVDAGVVGLGN